MSSFKIIKGSSVDQEVDAIVNSKDGRRFARSYDRILGRRLNQESKTFQQ